MNAAQFSTETRLLVKRGKDGKYPLAVYDTSDYERGCQFYNEALRGRGVRLPGGGCALARMVRESVGWDASYEAARECMIVADFLQKDAWGSHAADVELLVSRLKRIDDRLAALTGRDLARCSQESLTKDARVERDPETRSVLEFAAANHRAAVEAFAELRAQVRAQAKSQKGGAAAAARKKKGGGDPYVPPHMRPDFTKDGESDVTTPSLDDWEVPWTRYGLPGWDYNGNIKYRDGRFPRDSGVDYLHTLPTWKSVIEPHIDGLLEERYGGPEHKVGPCRPCVADLGFGLFLRDGLDTVDTGRIGQHFAAYYPAELYRPNAAGLLDPASIAAVRRLFNRPWNAPLTSEEVAAIDSMSATRSVPLEPLACPPLPPGEGDRQLLLGDLYYQYHLPARSAAGGDYVTSAWGASTDRLDSNTERSWNILANLKMVKRYATAIDLGEFPLLCRMPHATCELFLPGTWPGLRSASSTSSAVEYMGFVNIATTPVSTDNQGERDLWNTDLTCCSTRTLFIFRVPAAGRSPVKYQLVSFRGRPVNWGQFVEARRVLYHELLQIWNACDPEYSPMPMSAYMVLDPKRPNVEDRYEAGGNNGRSGDSPDPGVWLTVSPVDHTTSDADAYITQAQLAERLGWGDRRRGAVAVDMFPPRIPVYVLKDGVGLIPVCLRFDDAADRNKGCLRLFHRPVSGRCTGSPPGNLSPHPEHLRPAKRQQAGGGASSTPSWIDFETWRDGMAALAALRATDGCEPPAPAKVQVVRGKADGTVRVDNRLEYKTPGRMVVPFAHQSARVVFARTKKPRRVLIITSYPGLIDAVTVLYRNAVTRVLLTDSPNPAMIFNRLKLTGTLKTCHHIGVPTSPRLRRWFAAAKEAPFDMLVFDHPADFATQTFLHREIADFLDVAGALREGGQLLSWAHMDAEGVVGGAEALMSRFSGLHFAYIAPNPPPHMVFANFVGWRGREAAATDESAIALRDAAFDYLRRIYADNFSRVWQCIAEAAVAKPRRATGSDGKVLASRDLVKSKMGVVPQPRPDARTLRGRRPTARDLSSPS